MSETLNDVMTIPVTAKALRLDLELCRHLAKEKTGGEVSEQMAMMIGYLHAMAIMLRQIQETSMMLTMPCQDRMAQIELIAQSGIELTKGMDL